MIEVLQLSNIKHQSVLNLDAVRSGLSKNLLAR